MLIEKLDTWVDKQRRILPSDIDLAYSAGIIDGEGSVILHRHRPSPKSKDKHPRHVVEVRVGMTDRAIPILLQELFGGAVSIKHDPRGYKDIYTWSVKANVALRCLKQIRPFLKVKTEQADLCIYFQSSLIRKTGWKGDGLSQEECRMRDEVHARLLALTPRAKSSALKYAMRKAAHAN